MGELMAEEATTQQVRSEPRVPASAVPQITGVKLSPGDAVVLVNLSAGGVLVEGNRRFVPKTRVTVNFEGEFDPPQLRACKEITACTVGRRVVRCARGVGHPAGKACSAGARAHGAIAPGVGGD